MTNTPAASPRRVLVATAVAVILASVTLVVAVLPAEYGIDPLGTGRALGLTALAATDEEAPLAPSSLEAVRVGVNTRQSAPLAQDTFTVELRPFEGVEYKYRAEQGTASCTNGPRRRMSGTTFTANRMARRPGLRRVTAKVRDEQRGDRSWRQRQAFTDGSGRIPGLAVSRSH